jgi:IS66 Orf2 like protein
MLQITPQMKILVAVEPADFRRGIDGLARLCQQALHEDPFAGTVFVFRNRRGTALKVLMYDGQGFWLCHKRLSQGRFNLLAVVADQLTITGSIMGTLKEHGAGPLQRLLGAGNLLHLCTLPWVPLSLP